MSSVLEQIYDSGRLRIEKDAAGNFFLRTKWRPFALIFAVIVCSVIGFAFGAVAFFALQEFWERGLKNWKDELIGFAFGICGLTFPILVLRAAFWECIPKTLRIDQKAKACVIRTYLFLRWTIPFDELQAVGLKIGRQPIKSGSGFWNCLYLLKSYGIKRLRLCTVSEGGSKHESLKDGLEVAEIISSALNVLVIQHTKKKGWPKI